MGINGANTTVQVRNSSAGGSGSGGGGSGGGSTPGRGSNEPPGDVGWVDAPAPLKAEILATTFNRAATLGGDEAWRNLVDQFPAKTDVLQVVQQNQGEGSRLLWMDYGKKRDEPVMVDNQLVSYASGAIHIYERHADHIAMRLVNKNASQEEQDKQLARQRTHIMRTVANIASLGTLLEVGSADGKGYEIREWHGSKWCLAIGSNGFIVTAYPEK